jgi:hypothetical protein
MGARFLLFGVPMDKGDTIAPTCVLTSDATEPVSAAFTLTVTFSEDVTGFVVGDITAVNCALSDFATADNITFTATVTPTATAGDITLDIAAGVCTDNAGIDNTAAVQLVVQHDPTVIADAFTADSGAWLDGALAPAAVTISSGRAIWSPTASAEQHVAANAASDPNGNEANATTGWSATLATLTSEADPYAGTYAIKGAGGTRIQALPGFTEASWILFSWAAKRGAVTGPTVAAVQGTPNIIQTPDSTYNAFFGTSRAISTTFQIRGATGAADREIFIDNLSTKTLTTTSLIRWQPVYWVSSINVKFWRSNNTQAGVIIGKDANNFIVLYHDGQSRIVLETRAAGAYAAIANGVIAYSAGAELSLTPDAAFGVFDGTYNGTAAIIDAAIAAFSGDISGGRFTVPYYVGLFKTYNSGNILSDSFDDFWAAKLGEGSPF